MLRDHSPYQGLCTTACAFLHSRWNIFVLPSSVAFVGFEYKLCSADVKDSEFIWVRGSDIGNKA